MGQEASLPANQDLEEQARAPPSTASPPRGEHNGTAAARPGRKLIGGILRGHGGGHGGGGHDVESYEQREAARAAAEAGNLYLHDGSSVDFASARYHPQQPQNAYETAAASIPPGAVSPGQQAYYPQQPYGGDGPSAAGVASMPQHLQGSKKSLFPGRASARGMISSMRNLSLGGALRKQKELSDWEKQWDEDEDEDSDEEDVGPDYGAMQMQAARHGGMIPQKPGMDVGHSTGPPLDAVHIGAARQLDVKPAATPPAEDLLSKPIVTPSPQQQQAPPSPVAKDTLDWDLTTQKQQQQLDQKPNVEMFLPMLRVLGKGSFGKVVLVQKRVGKERGQLFAMKILRKTHLVKRRQIERTRTERKVLSVVNHPFIMKLHYAFQTPDKLYLVLDYCPGGELFFHLSRFRRFPERVARFYSAELLLAIGHLHKRGIIYRDLKPENVLLDAEGHVKLGDFGLAKAGIKHPYEGATSMCGTPEYMAPEVLAQLGHGFCVDYWGLGMIVYEMMTGLPPWYTTDRAQLFRRLKSAPLDIPSYFSPASADCVSALLERNPRRRLGVTGIRAAMEHDFFRNISWRSLYSRRVEAPIQPCEGWRPPDAVVDGDHPEAFRSMSVQETHSSFAVNNGIEKMGSEDLDTATQNFDNQFLRMPVESEDGGQDSEEDHELYNDLSEDTFLGFTFDIVKEREKVAAASSPARQRTHHYQQASDPSQQRALE